jgi:hypothetical protein
MRFLFAFLMLSLPLCAQEAVSKHLIIDPFYEGEITVYDNADGAVTGRFSNDKEQESFLEFTVEKEKEGWFYGKLTYTLGDKENTGWIKKESYVGVYARNYIAGNTLNLYKKPDATSKVQSEIPGMFDGFCTVKKVSGAWVYIEAEYNGEKKEGWLSPDMQCDNPYTTCN